MISARFYGQKLVQSYGDVKSEYDAVRSGVAFVDRSHNIRVKHSGDDALDLLHRLTTNNLNSLGKSMARATVLTSEKGRVIEVMDVIRHADDALLLMAGPAVQSKLIEWIDRFTIIEDSCLENVTDQTLQITLLGPNADRLSTNVFGSAAAALARGEILETTVDSVPVDVIKPDGPNLSSIEVVVPISGGASVWRALVESGATPAGMEAYEAARIEFGTVASGWDVNEDTNPLEAGLESIIDFDKGCYVGQEVIARLDTYDKLQRCLVGFVGLRRLASGESILNGDRRIGIVTSEAHSPLLDRPVGLGYVRKGFANPGTFLKTETSNEIEIMTFPIVS